MTPPNQQPEEIARNDIDRMLEQAGWIIQDAKDRNLTASLGVVIREEQTSTGPADYALYIDAKICGIIEAKKEGTALGGVAEQSTRYSTSEIPFVKRWVPDDQPLPFLYEATNIEIRFRDNRDPHPRSRCVFHFHRPETFKQWLEADPETGATLRARFHNLPALHTEGLRDCQIQAINGIEASLKDAKPRALLQMATGAGKTFAAVTQIYRLAKYCKAKRVLFLVDRGNLGRQAHKEFQQYSVPNDGRKFTDLYNVHMLGAGNIGDEIKVTISTVQRMYARLTNKELDDDADELSGFETESNTSSDEARCVAYNPNLPIETFDIIIIDECHRSIYNLWRQVLDYFDAFLIGLTATPTKKTLGFFNQNMVAEYTHENAIVDRVNVGYDIYRIKTKKSEEGDLIEAGTAVEVRDRHTKKKRLEILDQDRIYTAKQLDRSVIAPNQIGTVIQAFKDNALPECFPERTWVPKTLIFAKDDDHADRIVDCVREVFNEGNDFCKKVTYKVGKKTAENTITEFRTSSNLRIAVTVDMIATGTDIKPLECIIFMRDVRSQAYYEQMKGRGTRVIGIDDLHKVTPDAIYKTRFVLIDAVGVTETDKTETKSLEQKPSIPTHKLMDQIARGDRNPDTLRSLGNRLIRLDLQLSDNGRKQIKALCGQNLNDIAQELIACTNEDYLEEKACIDHNIDPDSSLATGAGSSVEQRDKIYEPLANAAIKPFNDPKLREKIEELRKDSEQVIDDSADELCNAGYDEEKAKGLIQNFQQFIKDHKDELDAIQLIYSKPYQQRHLSYEAIEKLAEDIQQPPYSIAPIEVWKAYDRLEHSRVKSIPTQKLLTNILSLIRFATGISTNLEPFPELVNRRFDAWLRQQQHNGTTFANEQLHWLELIKQQIAQNAEMNVDDFEYMPFNQAGGLIKARQLFGDNLNEVITELNGYLIA